MLLSHGHDIILSHGHCHMVMTLYSGQDWLHLCPTRLALLCTFDAAAAGANTAFELWFHSTAAILVDVPSWAERSPTQAASGSDSSKGKSAKPHGRVPAVV
jgi:hypothetical protein